MIAIAAKRMEIETTMPHQVGVGLRCLGSWRGLKLGCSFTRPSSMMDSKLTVSGHHLGLDGNDIELKNPEGGANTIGL